MYEILYYQNGEVLDFFQVRPPSVQGYDVVLGYWQELSRCLEDLSPIYWQDQVLFPRYRLYYQKLGELLFPGIPVADLVPDSRHSFFVTKGVEGGIVRLSGLQRLLGFEEITPSGQSYSGSGSSASTGRPDLDIVASLLVLQVPDVLGLVARYSVDELSAIANYVIQVKSGENGGVSEDQREQDRALVAQVMGRDPEMERSRMEAQQLLLTRHGPIAMAAAQLQSEKIRQGKNEST